jgi:hypothetical protein
VPVPYKTALPAHAPEPARARDRLRPAEDVKNSRAKGARKSSCIDGGLVPVPYKTALPAHAPEPARARDRLRPAEDVDWLGFVLRSHRGKKNSDSLIQNDRAPCVDRSSAWWWFGSARRATRCLAVAWRGRIWMFASDQQSCRIVTAVHSQSLPKRSLLGSRPALV